MEAGKKRLSGDTERQAKSGEVTGLNHEMRDLKEVVADLTLENRIPDEVRGQILKIALDKPDLSPRELAVTFTDEKSYFVSEASVYRLLKAHDLITSPAFIVMKAASEFKDKTTAPNKLWQTDFTYLKVIGCRWFYLSTILDDFSNYIIAWKLGTAKPFCSKRRR